MVAAAAPTFAVKLVTSNLKQPTEDVIRWLAGGVKNQLASSVLDGLELLDGDKLIVLDCSKIGHQSRDRAIDTYKLTALILLLGSMKVKNDKLKPQIDLLHLNVRFYDNRLKLVFDNRHSNSICQFCHLSNCKNYTSQKNRLNDCPRNSMLWLYRLFW